VRWHRLDPEHDLERLREFLLDSDPRDYLLEDLDEWTRGGRLWVGMEGGSWVAFGRIHDLGHGEGWVSGLRVGLSRRGEGLGSQLLNCLLSDARSSGLTELRAVIEDGNQASRRLFDRHGFHPIFEMTLRRAKAGAVGAQPLRPARAGDRRDRPIGWLPSLTGRVDLLPGSEGGRFGRWDPHILERWSKEGKLYVGLELAAAVQVDWLREPRTMWVNPLQGDPDSLLPAIAALAKTLGQEEWQAYLPSTEHLRQVYASLGLSPHAFWGDRIHLYERTETSSASP
jgi:RimJ/RimL family protein N-acetyltransferase